MLVCICSGLFVYGCAALGRVICTQCTDAQFVECRTEFAISTLRASKRMDRKARRAASVRHDTVWKMAIDGVHSLSVSDVHTACGKRLCVHLYSTCKLGKKTSKFLAVWQT